ncbi:MAG: DUF120 domain-containing protein [Methanobacteriota archaeon]|nr:MAG: DUF120 domain-containing protein [Euryarchaeota archaeon]
MPFQFQVHLDAELRRVVGDVEIAVPTPVLAELDLLADHDRNARAAAKLAKNYRTIEGHGSADDALLDLARDRRAQRGCDAGKGISAHRSSPARLKPYHVETLKAIALLGGTKEYVNLSSGELGKLVGVSQQSASQRILELIREGLVARDLATRRQRIRLTPRGGEVLRKEYADYQRIFEIKETLTISGAVASGLREGAFYMRQKGYKDQFRKKLWFEPYEGTLNLKIAGPDLAKLQILQESPGIEIAGFDAAGRTFGGAKCFLATVGHVDCAVIMPIRTHHTDVLEVISKHYLRGSLGLKDGDIVELIVSL